MIDRKLPFILTIEEKRSPLWRKLKEYCENRLIDLRNENDGDRPELETAKIRGRIAEAKLLISLGKDTPKIGRSLLDGSDGL